MSNPSILPIKVPKLALAGPESTKVSLPRQEPLIEVSAKEGEGVIFDGKTNLLKR